jgi:hypothetical protein
MEEQLERRVDFATIDLRLAEQYKAQIASSASIATRFHNALVGGYQSAVESVAGILVFFAEHGPSASPFSRRRPATCVADGRVLRH